MDLWEAFLAKCEYARRAGLDFYLFVSDMPSSAGRHYLKILGVRALLERESPSSYSSVTYADADSVPSDSTLSPVDYLNIGGDLIGSSNVQHIPIVMNGGIWIARNTPTARSILQSWWELRRGPKDQLALWETLFRHWRMRQGQGLFDDYENAQANALYYFVRERQRLGGRDCADSSTRCGSVLRQTGCLTQPFLVDSVLLLPVVPFFHESSSEPLPPIQTEYHASGWWCHKTCSLLHNQSSSDELLQTTHPPRSSLRRRRRHLASSPFTEPNDTTTNAPSVSSSCVASHIRAFVCPCGHILTKLAALNWCGGDEGSAVDAECVEVAAQNVSKSRLRIERHRKKQAIH